MSLTFEWDSDKAQINLSKHGVTFEEAATVFGDMLSATIPDPQVTDEERFVTLGRSATGRLLVVVHTDRGGSIRIISARVAERRERRAYEAGTI
jgi:uncharacterized DUF497 family protein